MSAQNWLRNLKNRSARRAASTGRPAPHRATLRPRLELLEDRTVPSTIAWDGGPTGNGTDWLDPVNWVGDVLPGATDDVTIGNTGNNPTISLSATTAVGGFANSRSLTVSGLLSVNGGGSNIGTINGAALQLGGTFANAGGSITADAVAFLQPGATIDGGSFATHSITANRFTPMASGPARTFGQSW